MAANTFLGCQGSAAERFELVRDFGITCSDKNVKTAKMSLDSVLAGFVRSKHRAEAGVRLATARVCPIDSPQPVMVITDPAVIEQPASPLGTRRHSRPADGHWAIRKAPDSVGGRVQRVTVLAS